MRCILLLSQHFLVSSISCEYLIKLSVLPCHCRIKIPKFLPTWLSYEIWSFHAICVRPLIRSVWAATMEKSKVRPEQQKIHLTARARNTGTAAVIFISPLLINLIIEASLTGLKQDKAPQNNSSQVASTDNSCSGMVLWCRACSCYRWYYLHIPSRVSEEWRSWWRSGRRRITEPVHALLSGLRLDSSRSHNQCTALFVFRYQSGWTASQRRELVSWCGQWVSDRFGGTNLPDCEIRMVTKWIGL